MIFTSFEDTEIDEELVGSEPGDRNWKGIGISLLVIFIIFSLITLSVVIKQRHKEPEDLRERFTFEDIHNKKFEANRFSGQWLNNDKLVYQDHKSNDILVFDCTTLTSDVIVSSNTHGSLYGKNIKFWTTNVSENILFAYDIKYLHRYSFTARYAVFSIRYNINLEVLPTHVNKTSAIQNAVLSPNSKSLAFVYENNIYLLESVASKEVNQITFDGEDLDIYNGIADWLYEEEILERSNTIWWSPDSQNIAYLKINNTLVDLYEFPIYDGSQYNNKKMLKYPKVGRPIPTAKAVLHNVKTNKSIELSPPENFNEFYIWNVQWLDANSVIVVYVNRKQTWSTTIVYDMNGKVLMPIIYPTLENNDGWSLPVGLLTSSKHQLFFQIWHFEGYKAIVMFNAKTGVPKVITHHKFDVMEFLSYNEETSYIYYTATNGDYRMRHIFMKHVDFEKVSSAECLTCNLMLDDTEKACDYSWASFSKNDDYYIFECLGRLIPSTRIKRLTNKTFEYVLEKNDDLRNLLATKILGLTSYLEVHLDNHTDRIAYAEVLSPPIKDEKPYKGYPVLVHVYNGPSSQTVDFQFRIRPYETYLAVNYRAMVVTMDGRGVDGRGDRYLKAVYKRLGELETIDQINLAKQLKLLDYTDNDRFGIWGWSYGGFLSAMSLLHPLSEFNCSISGAPVTDWSLYDAAYTERYMSLIDENQAGYGTKSNLTHFALINRKNLNGKHMLLIHGTGDDNVHFQNSAILAKVLYKSNLNFTFDVYPDIQHTPDEDMQRYLYTRITTYLQGCMGLVHNEEEHVALSETASHYIPDPYWT